MIEKKQMCGCVYTYFHIFEIYQFVLNSPQYKKIALCFFMLKCCVINYIFLCPHFSKFYKDNFYFSKIKDHQSSGAKVTFCKDTRIFTVNLEASAHTSDKTRHVSSAVAPNGPIYLICFFFTIWLYFVPLDPLFCQRNTLK